MFRRSVSFAFLSTIAFAGLQASAQTAPDSHPIGQLIASCATLNASGAQGPVRYIYSDGTRQNSIKAVEGKLSLAALVTDPGVGSISTTILSIDNKTQEVSFSYVNLLGLVSELSFDGSKKDPKTGAHLGKIKQYASTVVEAKIACIVNDAS